MFFTGCALVDCWRRKKFLPRLLLKGFLGQCPLEQVAKPLGGKLTPCKVWYIIVTLNTNPWQVLEVFDFLVQGSMVYALNDDKVVMLSVAAKGVSGPTTVSSMCS